ncbi:hypothetical protein E2P81_ATG07685 [Venturia nashicola]|uniref:Uncharacterized protein n=1 Tax=Venturia nashicola TaxID=86259 RepID=A0A4Z1NIG2_9PEZI|nr:hypothetical protein E6O75_ATG07849 [Venturia nashicola]TLD22492.1 hypothetical protein E2P81_ATG07685 [Venturia nashicola]
MAQLRLPSETILSGRCGLAGAWWGEPAMIETLSDIEKFPPTSSHHRGSKSWNIIPFGEKRNWSMASNCNPTWQSLDQMSDFSVSGTAEPPLGMVLSGSLCLAEAWWHETASPSGHHEVRADPSHDRDGKRWGSTSLRVISATRRWSLASKYSPTWHIRDGRRRLWHHGIPTDPSHHCGGKSWNTTVSEVVCETRLVPGVELQSYPTSSRWKTETLASRSPRLPLLPPGQ